MTRKGFCDLCEIKINESSCIFYYQKDSMSNPKAIEVHEDCLNQILLGVEFLHQLVTSKKNMKHLNNKTKKDLR